MADRPLLDGITVLDLASVGPAVRAARWLADWGADVVKVGPVPRDGGVHITPPAYAYSAHRGMRRVQLDLKSDPGRDAFLALAAAADVVIESFRPGVMDRLGIGWEALHATNPGLVLCSTTGFGQTGPRADWAGHDINYLAVGGYLHCSGRDERGGPALAGATIADSAGGGLQAVAAICAALAARAETGEGTHLDVSIADGVLSLMSLAVGAIEHRFFANLCRALGCGHWADHQYDDEAVDAMRADFAAAFATRTRDEWAAELGPADTCVSAVLDIPEVVADEQYAARGSFIEVVHPTAGPLRQVAAPMAGQVDATTLPVPDFAEPDTDTVLTEAGVDADTLAAWRSEGAIA